MRMNKLDDQSKRLEKLATLLRKALRSPDADNPEKARQIEEAVRLAGQIIWPEFLDELTRACEQIRTWQEANLQSRREKLLLAARAGGELFDEATRAVRVGIFRVEFEGESAVVSLGGVEVERTKEVGGEKLFKRLKELRAALEQCPLNRAVFFKQMQASYATCRRAGATNEFIAVRDLHRELMLERARASEAFRKRPEPKNVPAYPLHQFIFDLARFIQKGVAVGDDRLVTTTPSMRESAGTVFIPNLDHPLGNETPAARLAIKRNQ